MPRSPRGTQDARRRALESILRRRRPPTQQSLVQALALDSMSIPEVVGTIAGDDVVFVATPQRGAQRGLERCFGRILEAGNG